MLQQTQIPVQLLVERVVWLGPLSQNVLAGWSLPITPSAFGVGSFFRRFSALYRMKDITNLHQHRVMAPCVARKRWLAEVHQMLKIADLARAHSTLSYDSLAPAFQIVRSSTGIRNSIETKLELSHLSRALSIEDRCSSSAPTAPNHLAFGVERCSHMCSN